MTVDADGDAVVGVKAVCFVVSPREQMPVLEATGEPHDFVVIDQQANP